MTDRLPGARPDDVAAAVDGTLELAAFRIHEGLDHALVAGPIGRVWMDATPGRFANRCLPMLIANQSGWLLLNPSPVLLTWDGSRAVSGVTVRALSDGASPAVSHFGQGIVTWHVPYLFRTPPGWNLLVRGPSNCPKDGIYALEGVVETDWAPETFTMNWQLTRPGLEVRFEEGEPYAMLVPQRRGDLEDFNPVLRRLSEAGDAAAEHRVWAASRQAFNQQVAARQVSEGPGWQREYFQGRRLGGERVAQHQRRLRLREFRSADGDASGRELVTDGDDPARPAG